MSSGVVNAKETRKKAETETSLIKCKLRITLLFGTTCVSQVSRAKAFRNRKKDKDIFENDLAQEINGSMITFEDKDDNGEYLILDQSFLVDESSPQAMENMSKSIDDFIRKFCISSDIEKVNPCFYIPSVSCTPIIPTLFLQAFPPKYILKENNETNSDKIERNKGCTSLFGFDKIQLREHTPPVMNKEESVITQGIIQLSVLICYYTYFYLDVREQEDWSFFRKNLSEEKRILKYLNSKIKRTTTKGSLFTKVWNSIKISLCIPVSIIEKTFDFFCNYDGHLENRIYGRIKDVLDITMPQMNTLVYVEKIKEILSMCQPKHPIDMYSFFEKCGYWDYVKDDLLKKNVQKCEVKSCDTGFFSGYGGVLFFDGINHIYCLKGTDFDSYGRDWLATNVLQGLTGFSLQHSKAISKAKELNQSIDGNLFFVGHSLGGGLASAATIATKNRKAITFNAAGLNVIGVKLNQLFNNTAGILKPSQSWDRVFPYRIKGEVLDTAQKFVLRPLTLGTLERGYGINSVDLDIDEKVNVCAKKHGINNFLYRAVIEKLKPAKNYMKYEYTGTEKNKVVKIHFSAKGDFEATAILA